MFPVPQSRGTSLEADPHVLENPWLLEENIAPENQ
jgi:hypothetical protein